MSKNSVYASQQKKEIVKRRYTYSWFKTFSIFVVSVFGSFVLSPVTERLGLLLKSYRTGEVVSVRPLECPPCNCANQVNTGAKLPMFGGQTTAAPPVQQSPGSSFHTSLKNMIRGARNNNQ